MRVLNYVQLPSIEGETAIPVFLKGSLTLYPVQGSNTMKWSGRDGKVVPNLGDLGVYVSSRYGEWTETAGRPCGVMAPGAQFGAGPP